MIDFDEYLHQSEPDKRAKSYAWQTAIGLQAVDGLKTSDYLLDTVRKDIEGEIDIDEVSRLIHSYYESKGIHTEEDEEQHEADKASVNIRRLLTEQTFAFTLVGLTSIHRRIFDGIFKFAGQIRDYNISKREWVMRGESVLYVSAPDIRRAIEYDLEQERQFDYSGVNPEGFIRHFARFIAGLWQIHPFGEGNTRTTAVFAIKYLRSMGFHIENDLFAKHAWYFRNALVRANYTNLQKGIHETTEYLEAFLRNLLLNEKNELHNRNLHISGLLNEEKVDIQDGKVDIESVLSQKGSDFSVKTTIHIHRLFEKFGFDEVFGRSAVMELLELKGSGASKLLSNLVQADIIEPVSGHGKGKYKFKK